MRSLSVSIKGHRRCRRSSVFVVSSVRCRSSSSPCRSVISLCRLLVSSSVGRQSLSPSCLICRRRVVGRAVCQSSVFVIIGHRHFVTLSVIGHSRLVVQLSVCRSSLVVGLHCLIVGPSWSLSGVVGQSSVLVGVRPHPHRVSSISSSVVCHLPRSLSSVVLSSGVCRRPSPVVACRSSSSVVICRLWLSVICGCPSPVGVRRLWSSVVH